jgi:hypothetical protein
MRRSLAAMRPASSACLPVHKRQAQASCRVFLHLSLTLGPLRPCPRPCSLFYASSACIYPEYKQLDVEIEGGGLKESDAWPAQPQDAYGLEKLATEELCMHYDKDFGIECRIGRFHNIYGPHGTWKGGREKAPAAFCRKVCGLALRRAILPCCFATPLLRCFCAPLLLRCCCAALRLLRCAALAAQQ